LTQNGNLQVSGSITASGDVIGNGISLDKHVHGGVQSGGSMTATPQG
jgi:phage baseplate assembly protein V